MNLMKICTALCLLAIFNFNTCHAQTATDIAAYSMEITVADSTIAMTCTSGCDWKTLSTANDGKPKVISSIGIANVADGVPQSDFIFVLYKKKKQLELMSLQGSAWTQLRMSCTSKSCTYHLDQEGISH
jgi:hypothetical protein